MVPLFAVGWIAWILIFIKGMKLFWHRTPGEKHYQALEYLAESTWYEKIAKGLKEREHLGKERTAEWLEEYLAELHLDLYKHLRTIAQLAAVAPLIGLLGTVSGMRATFDVITKFGFGNPAMLAEGISESLLTTQSGLVIAFPIVLAHNLLRNRVFHMEKSLQRHGARVQRTLFQKGEV